MMLFSHAVRASGLCGLKVAKNHICGLYRGYIGVVEKKMETTTYSGYIGTMEKKMETIILGDIFGRWKRKWKLLLLGIDWDNGTENGNDYYWGYIRRMEKEMETTI